MSNLNEMMKLSSGNSNIAEVIEKVNSSFPSIFTKQDVTELLSLINVRIGCQEQLIHKLKSKIGETINNFDFESGACDFSIDRGNVIVLDEFSVENITELQCIIEAEIDQVFDNGIDY